jgi:hypothetical protein
MGALENFGVAALVGMTKGMAGKPYGVAEVALAGRVALLEAYQHLVVMVAIQMALEAPLLVAVEAARVRALVRVAKFAFGQLGDSHAKS